jgi:ankyrin repeat protein
MKALLLQDGANIKAVEETEGIPLLVKAVINRSPKVVRFLLTRNGVDPNVKNDEGQTPLAYAAHECFNDIVKILLKCPHVDVNCSDNSGCTPLRLAAGRSHVYVVRTLLSNPSVDVSVRDNIHHRTALSAAVMVLWGRIS